MNDERWLSIVITAAGCLLMLCAVIQDSINDVIGCLILGATITLIGVVFIKITFWNR